ncbi:hypothetical protein GGF46_000963 [Coemansia sp. RSA 552]|nr:hypothetical protein GGF46_000963 [Coemansia sp. RSA 552]
MADSENWQTVPVRPARRGRGRGRARGSRSTSSWREGPSSRREGPSSEAFRLETSNVFAPTAKVADADVQGLLAELDLDDDDGGGESSDGGTDSEADFVVEPTGVQCPFCGTGVQLAGVAAAAEHLRAQHDLELEGLEPMTLVLQRYLDAWAERLGRPGACVDAEGEREVRSAVQEASLCAVLAAQEQERAGAARVARKCLFCRRMCADRRDLFRHAYREHSFNIGLPDNLVDVDEFLGILEHKLAQQQCVYCERTFPSAVVLRRHMRKKKHFKISSRNRLYDRFYVVNYLDPGRPWEAIELDNNGSDLDDASDAWDDWLEDGAQPRALSLFDSRSFATPPECWGYLRSEYGFDLGALRKSHDLDFHRTVVFINAIRRSTRDRACFACGLSFADGDGLAAHLRSDPAHLQPPAADAGLWSDPELLRPAVDGDVLLMAFEEDDTGGESQAPVGGESRK